MSYRLIVPGGLMVIRAEALELARGAIKARVADFPHYVTTHWVPERECAPADPQFLDELLARLRRDDPGRLKINDY